MTLRLNSLFLLLCLAAWLTVGLVVINHNIAPLGRVTLNWPNPAYPTVYWQWDAKPTPGSGLYPRGVWLPPGQAARFTVHLPRGFADGTMTVALDSAMSLSVQLRAETLTGRPVHSTSSPGNTVRLSFPWADLVAHGREFSFVITSLQSAGPVQVRSMRVSASR